MLYRRLYKPAVKYCEQGCQFMCQQCYDDHQSMGITKRHNVIPASEGETLSKSKIPSYPPCNRHKHQVLDLYCCTYNMPICVTCSQANHRSHDCIELDKRAAVCKSKLEQISEKTDWVIQYVKQAIDKTKCQLQLAETDIDEMCDNVKTTFKLRHQKLDEEEAQIVSELQDARRRVNKTCGIIQDSQTMTLASLESLNYCQVELAGKGTVYDYVTVTDSIQRDVENHYKGLPGLLWKCQMVNTNKIPDVCGGKVEFNQSEITKKKDGEISRICLHQQSTNVLGMVVYRQCVYVGNLTGLVVYMYNPDGSLGNSYKHEGGAETVVQGMCLMMNEDKACCQ